MYIEGYKLLLQDFCKYCPDFEPEVEMIDLTSFIDGATRACHNIRCKNRKRCARIAENIARQVRTDGR